MGIIIAAINKMNKIFLPGKRKRENAYAAIDEIMMMPMTTETVYNMLFKKYLPKPPYIQAW